MQKENLKEMKELNLAVSILLDGGSRQSKESQNALSNIFDLLLWSQKRSAEALQQILDSKIMGMIFETYQDQMETIVLGMTMLLGNAKESGLLSRHILQNKLGDKILISYLDYLSKQGDIDDEEHLQMLGSLLKAYYRHFTAYTYKYFVQNQKCLIIDICCRFFNCPEEITRTSVMNILMSILKESFIGQILQCKAVGIRVGSWCRDMCRLLRNELKDFDQNLLITDQGQSQFIIHSINDKIILWEDLSSIIPHLFAPYFHQEIVLPLIVGSFNTNGIPLFTLKFALFLVSKLIPTIGKLGLLNQLGNLLFLGKVIEYYDHQLSTAILSPFRIRKLLAEESVLDKVEDDEPNTFQNMNQFFLNIFKSKDGRFLQCACILLFNLMSQVKKSEEASSYFIGKLGFGLGGHTIFQLSSVIITHFTAIHTLQITRILASLLIYIQPNKYLDDEIKNELIRVYTNILEEVVDTIEKHQQIHPYLAEMLEYDVLTLFSDGCSLEMVMRTDAALLFNNQIIENQTLPFYQQIPETAPVIGRYQVVKSFILRKICKKLIGEYQQKSLENYHQLVKHHESSYIKPGEYLRLPITVNSYKCKLEDGKINIPNCLLLEDRRNLIVGFIENMKVRIIMNFKYKHTRIDIIQKKEKRIVSVNLTRYNQKSQNIEEVKGFLLKHLEIGQEYFYSQRNKFIHEEIAALKELICNAKKSIPVISLI